MLKLLSCLVINIGFSTSAFAIHCNVCNAPIDADCADPFTVGNKYATDCNKIENPSSKFFKVFGTGTEIKRPNAVGCVKIKADIMNNVITVRECYYGNISAGCMDVECTGIKLLACEICTTDLCNSSASTGIITAAVMSFIAVVVRMLS